MKVKNLIQILENYDRESEVELEFVKENGDSYSYAINGHYSVDIFDEDLEEDTDIVSLVASQEIEFQDRKDG